MLGCFVVTIGRDPAMHHPRFPDASFGTVRSAHGYPNGGGKNRRN
jgi:hypothetical protein